MPTSEREPLTFRPIPFAACAYLRDASQELRETHEYGVPVTASVVRDAHMHAHENALNSAFEMLFRILFTDVPEAITQAALPQVL